MQEESRFQREFRERRAEEVRLRKVNLKRIFDCMEHHNIVEITVRYSGGGDSGQTDEIESNPHMELGPENSQRFGYSAGHEVMEKIADKYPHLIQELSSSQWTAESGMVTSSKDSSVFLSDAVESMADSLVSVNHGGYYNNEGGYGTVTFRTEGRQVVNDHVDYYQAEQASVNTFDEHGRDYGEDMD